MNPAVIVRHELKALSQQCCPLISEIGMNIDAAAACKVGI
jgi:hypothetical protein